MNICTRDERMPDPFRLPDIERTEKLEWFASSDFLPNLVCTEANDSSSEQFMHARS
jgi:hypothetical protein